MLEGFGNKIRSFTIDGKIMDKAEIPANLIGKHEISIILSDNTIDGKVSPVTNYFSPSTPQIIYSGGKISWQKVDGARSYSVLKNGKVITRTSATSFVIPTSRYSEYQVVAIDKKGVGSFASEPLVVPTAGKMYEVEDYYPGSGLGFKGFTGKGFVEISKTVNKELKIPVKITQSGNYAIDFRYANGNGPTNTENKCGIRTLKEGNKILGTVVFPQRGNEEWSNWGYSNAVQVHLEKGAHVLKLSLEEWNQNMNGTVNQAMVDNLRIVLL